MVGCQAQMLVFFANNLRFSDQSETYQSMVQEKHELVSPSDFEEEKRLNPATILADF